MSQRTSDHQLRRQHRLCPLLPSRVAAIPASSPRASRGGLARNTSESTPPSLAASAGPPVECCPRSPLPHPTDGQCVQWRDGDRAGPRWRQHRRGRQGRVGAGMYVPAAATNPPSLGASWQPKQHRRRRTSRRRPIPSEARQRVDGGRDTVNGAKDTSTRAGAPRSAGHHRMTMRGAAVGAARDAAPTGRPHLPHPRTGDSAAHPPPARRPHRTGGRCNTRGRCNTTGNDTSGGVCARPGFYQ